MRVPLGVIAIIYESRPNVTARRRRRCASSRGNAVILRGGSEAFHSNHGARRAARGAALADGRAAGRRPCRWSPTTDRAAVGELLKLDDEIDLVIPRGGEGLIRVVAEKLHASR